MISFTSTEVNQNFKHARESARDLGPVVITNRGEPEFVLMSYSDYRKLGGLKKPNIVELLYSPDAAEIDFDPHVPGKDNGLRPVEF